MRPVNIFSKDKLSLIFYEYLSPFHEYFMHFAVEPSVYEDVPCSAEELEPEKDISECDKLDDPDTKAEVSDHAQIEVSECNANSGSSDSAITIKPESNNELTDSSVVSSTPVTDDAGEGQSIPIGLGNSEQNSSVDCIATVSGIGNHEVDICSKSVEDDSAIEHDISDYSANASHSSLPCDSLHVDGDNSEKNEEEASELGESDFAIGQDILDYSIQSALSELKRLSQEELVNLSDSAMVESESEGSNCEVGSNNTSEETAGNLERKLSNTIDSESIKEEN